jgi:ABC-type uncharacterized transport system fused permease/ATPase subunit
MKKHSEYLASVLTKITGFLFFSQILMEVSGMVVRKSGFEYTLHLCLFLFSMSIIYWLLLMTLNKMNTRKANDYK